MNTKRLLSVGSLHIGITLRDYGARGLGIPTHRTDERSLTGKLIQKCHTNKRGGYVGRTEPNSP
jgi:hypothetical protein